MKPTQPFQTFFCYSPDLQETKEIVEKIYHALSPEPNGYSDNYRHVPIFLYSNPDNAFLELTKSDCSNVLIFIFIDSLFIIESRWNDFVRKITEQLAPKPVIVPIALHENFLTPFPLLSQINAIRAFDFERDKLVKIKFLIAYRIASELMKLYEGITDLTMKLFISHSKRDGLELAVRIKKYIDENTTLKRFLDENNIPSGENFIEVIEKNISDSIMLVILSDSFSSREYCRREVLSAKKQHRIILVLEALEKGEERSFAYLGNVKTIKYDTRINYYDLFFEIFNEYIRKAHFQISAKFIIGFTSKRMKKYEFDPYPPELLSVFGDGKSRNHTIIYPDPPLSKYEMQLLQYATNNKYYTPTIFQLKKDNYDSSMESVLCSLSVSEISEITMDNASEQILHLLYQLSRYLFACGSQIVYGGKLHYSSGSNFLQFLFDLSKAYSDETRQNPKVINYFLSETDIPQNPTDLANFAPLLEFRKSTKYYEELSKTSELTSESKERILLSGLRQEVVSRSNSSVIAGGKMSGFNGMLPGVIEEFTYAIHTKHPIYVVGGFGGASGAIANLFIQKRKETALSIIERTFIQNRIIEYNQFAFSNSFEPFSFFVKSTDLSLEMLNNGLTKKENMILMTTTNIQLIVTLIIKGLNRIYKRYNTNGGK